jgi:hypothetical protein
MIEIFDRIDGLLVFTVDALIEDVGVVAFVDPTAAVVVIVDDGDADDDARLSAVTFDAICLDNIRRVASLFSTNLVDVGGIAELNVGILF